MANFFEGIGSAFNQGLRALAPGAAQNADLAREKKRLDIQKIQDFLDTSEMRKRLNDARVGSYEGRPKSQDEKNAAVGLGYAKVADASSDPDIINHAKKEYFKAHGQEWIPGVSPEEMGDLKNMYQDRFDAGVKGLKAKQGEGYTASDEDAATFRKNFVADLVGDGVDKKAAGGLYNQLHDDEVGKAAWWRDDVLSERLTGPNPFDKIAQDATEGVPISTRPKNFEELGLNSPDQIADFDELDTALGKDLDLKKEVDLINNDPRNNDPTRIQNGTTPKEIMKKLMAQWKAGGLSTAKLKEWFSIKQTSAQSALGIK